MKILISYILTFWSIVFALSSCSSSATGTKHTVMSQTGNNKVFPSNKESKKKSRKYRASKSALKSKQREQARFQGHEDVSQ